MISTEQLTAIAEGRFYYIASPYTHPDPAVRDARAHEVNRYSGALMQAGVYVYATIWATHHIAVRHALPTDFEWWLGFNKAFIDPAAGVIVANIPGWRESKGVAQEIGYARELGHPIFLASLTERLVVEALPFSHA